MVTIKTWVLKNCPNTPSYVIDILWLSVDKFVLSLWKFYLVTYGAHCYQEMHGYTWVRPHCIMGCVPVHILPKSTIALLIPLFTYFSLGRAKCKLFNRQLFTCKLNKDMSTGEGARYRDSPEYKMSYGPR